MSLPYWSLLIAVLAASAVAALFLGLYRLLRPAGDLEDRLRSTVARGDANRAHLDVKESLSSAVGKINVDKRLAGDTANELTRADVALTVNEYILLRFGGALVGFLVGVLGFRSLLLGMVLTILALQGPVILVHFLARRRRERFQAQLVDVITMLCSGLKAGVGLVQAMELVRKEMPEPAGSEFGRVVREHGLGIPLPTALARLTDRMPGDDLQMLVTVVNIQLEVGGNLASILDTVVTTIRERIRIAQEIRTLTAMQRVTGYILGGLPFILGGAIFVINPDYIMTLFQPRWLWMPGVTLVSVVLGYIVIGRIVDIKV